MVGLFGFGLTMTSATPVAVKWKLIWEFIGNTKHMNMLGKWISNTYDPDGAYIKDWTFLSNQSPKEYVNWVNQFVRGRPMATEHYTVEQLEEMGMIGLYEPQI